MSTSGQILATTTARDIIQEALELMGALSEGETANSAQESSLLRTLNNLCVTWQADGLNLFAVTTYFLFLNADQKSYKIPDSTTRIAYQYTPNNTTESQTAGNNTITVLETVPADHDTVGVILDDGTMYWDTISSYSSDTITLSTNLPQDVNEGASVFTYKDIPVYRPMKTLSGHIYQKNNASIPMSQLSREEYETLTNKNSLGVPLQYYADLQATFQEVSIWPVPPRNDMVMELTVQRQLDTSVNAANDVAYPAEWFMPLAMNLAAVSSAKYGVPRFDYTRIKGLADEQYEMAKHFDFEWGTSLYLSPDTRGASCG